MINAEEILTKIDFDERLRIVDRGSRNLRMIGGKGNRAVSLPADSAKNLLSTLDEAKKQFLHDDDLPLFIENCKNAIQAEKPILDKMISMITRETSSSIIKLDVLENMVDKLVNIASDSPRPKT